MLNRATKQNCGPILSSAITLESEPFQVFGGADRDRTDDLHIANVTLSQLSYGPECLLF